MPVVPFQNSPHLSPSLGSIAVNASPLPPSGLEMFQDTDPLVPEHSPEQVEGHTQMPLTWQRQQFALLEVARHLYPEDARLHNCHQVRVSVSSPLGVYALSDGRLVLSNAQTCGRAYCPVCGPRIRSRRGHELVAIAQTLAAQGFRVLRVDWTHAHERGTSMATQVQAQQSLFGRLTSGKRGLGQQLKRLGEYAGGRRALDYTYGREGHHLHAHSVLFVRTDAPPEEVEQILRGLYGAAARHVGLRVGAAGVHVAEIAPEGARYLHKSGLLPRVDRGVSMIPAQLLSLAGQGDAEAAQAWQEYARGLRGLRTLSTTPGLRAQVAQALCSGDAQDAQLARMAVPQEAKLLQLVQGSMPSPVHLFGAGGQLPVVAA